MKHIRGHNINVKYGVPFSLVNIKRAEIFSHFHTSIWCILEVYTIKQQRSQVNFEKNIIVKPSHVKRTEQDKTTIFLQSPIFNHDSNKYG